MQDHNEFWPDGTRKSKNNAFTAHGYKPGVPVKTSPAPALRKQGGFAKNHGTIAGGLQKRHDLVLNRKARA